MNKNEYVCVCHRVSLGKLRSYIKRENPVVASQLSECLGSGTSCGWCIPFLNKLYECYVAGKIMDLEIDTDVYLEQRKAYNRENSSKEIEDE